MIIRIVREPSSNRGTFGVVFVDGRFFGFSLEDEIREKPGVPVSAWKIKGVTAIPAGRYRLRMAVSPRLRREVPWIDNVDGFSYVQIHPLNKVEETDGCIGIGYTRTSDPVPTIGKSVAACDVLNTWIKAAGGADLLIENPPDLRTI